MPSPSFAVEMRLPLPGVPEEYDCAIRELVWQQGQKLLPARGSFRSLFEARSRKSHVSTPSRSSAGDAVTELQSDHAKRRGPLAASKAGTKAVILRVYLAYTPSSRYPAPSDAIYVDSRGQDHHPGTLHLPVRQAICMLLRVSADEPSVLKCSEGPCKPP